MICPFCRQTDIVDNSGNTVCPSCKTVFEIDDRGECVFVDTDSPRMPMLGRYAQNAGWFSKISRESCVWCGTSHIATDASPVTPPRSGA
jgi:hypothetical protein